MLDKALLTLLADGAFHSGDALGAALSISRSAVWKRVAALKECGIDVHSVPGKGYRLARPLDLLDAAAIRGAITPEACNSLDSIEVLAQTASTNDVLMARAREGLRARTALFAEQQTAGRGRRGRQWVSPFAANIYLSVLCEFPGGVAALDGLSLAVGVAAGEALQASGVSGVGLKWPNDLLIGGKKVGGILVEIIGEASDSCVAVIGIGINVRMGTDRVDAIDQPWTDLDAAGYRGSRNQVAAALLTHMTSMLDEFSRRGFRGFIERWRRLDLTQGKPVYVLAGDSRIAGVSMGINDSGALLVDVDGDIRAFHGGEVSVRGQA